MSVVSTGSSSRCLFLLILLSALSAADLWATGTASVCCPWRSCRFLFPTLLRRAVHLSGSLSKLLSSLSLLMFQITATIVSLSPDGNSYSCLLGLVTRSLPSAKREIGGMSILSMRPLVPVEDVPNESLSRQAWVTRCRPLEYLLGELERCPAVCGSFPPAVLWRLSLCRCPSVHVRPACVKLSVCENGRDK